MTSFFSGTPGVCLGLLVSVSGLALLSPACGGGSSSGGSGGDGAGGSGAGGFAMIGGGGCAPLPEPTGSVIEVTPEQADELPGIVRDAPEGATILLADGTYTMTGGDEASRRIQIVSPHITLRSKSRKRASVVIDGEYVTEEIIVISASNVTVGDITIRRALHHPIHVTGGPDDDAWSTVLHNLHIEDAGQQFVKVNPSGSTPDTYADHGVLECSLLELTADGRPNVATEPGGCYTGGIDGHQARGWRIHKNIFRGIYCENGSLAEHAIHFWTGSRDTMIEDNLIVDCARGIGFGLGDGSGVEDQRSYVDDPYPDVDYVGHYDGIIRNNMIAITPGLEFFDTGIELEQAVGTKVLHNTVIHPDTAFASISHRFANTRVVLENNLVRTIRGRDGSEASGTTNLEHAPDDLFINVAEHDLHLRKTAALAIDKGKVVSDSGNDIDGDVRDGAPDIGADELDP